MDRSIYKLYKILMMVVCRRKMMLNIVNGRHHFVSWNSPEDIGMGQSVHQLDLSQHVGSITAQFVHLQSHHLARHSVAYLQRTQQSGQFGIIGMLLFNTTVPLSIFPYRGDTSLLSLFQDHGERFSFCSKMNVLPHSEP